MSIWTHSSNQCLPIGKQIDAELVNTASLFIDYGAINDPFWNAVAFYKYIVSSYSEVHEDSADIIPVFADTFIVFGHGAMPVIIKIDGFLKTIPEEDDRLDFTEFYIKYFRGTMLKKTGMKLVFALRDTVMRLHLTDMTMDINSRMHDYVRTSLSGIGFRYDVMSSVFTGFENVSGPIISEEPGKREDFKYSYSLGPGTGNGPPILDKRQTDYPRPLPAAHSQIVNDAAEANVMDPKLIAAIIYVESKNNQYAVSPKGAQGYMQLMPATSAEMGVKNPFDASQNIYGGTKYFSRMMKLRNGNVKESLMAYNGGPNAKSYGEESRTFAQRVITLWRNN